MDPHKALSAYYAQRLKTSNNLILNLRAHSHFVDAFIKIKIDNDELNHIPHMHLYKPTAPISLMSQPQKGPSELCRRARWSQSWE